MRELVLDWRGVPDLSRPADFYSVSSNTESRPVTGNPKGRVLAAFSMTIHYTPDRFVVDRPFNRALSDIAFRYAAEMPGTVLAVEPNGYFTRPIDLTKRGIVGPILTLLKKQFAWADGYHWDQFTPLSDPVDPWDRVFSGMAEDLRKDGKLVLVQQFHPTASTSAASGCFFEKSPTNFGYTMARHGTDVKDFRDLVKRVDGRETLFVCELRQDDGTATFPQWYIDQVSAWCEANDIVLSLGRDAAAGKVFNP